jgi:hypothetical protein
MYNAIITKLGNIRKHSNADRLNISVCWGNQVIIGLNSKDGDWGIYFPTDGQLSEEFSKKNDLIRRKDETGKNVGGMFDENRRIRTQKFRGEVSDGFWCPISLLSPFFGDIKINEDHVVVGGNKLPEGYEFTSINGILICQKYVTPNTKTHSGQPSKKSKFTGSKMFKEQFETEQLGINLYKIPVDSLVIISEKQHGCVDKDTIIETLEYGPMKIKDIVDQKLKCLVKSFDIQSNTIVWGEVSDYYFYPDDTDWYKITLDNDISLIITGNNPIWLPELNCYRNVENLLEGDIVLISEK